MLRLRIFWIGLALIALAAGCGGAARQAESTTSSSTTVATTVAPPFATASTQPTATVPASTQPGVIVPPFVGGQDGVVIVGSNAFSNESQTLFIVVGLRNDNTGIVAVGNAKLTIRDGAGNVIGTRTVLPFRTSEIMAVGETIFITDNIPSGLYLEGDTNTFPVGWATFDLTFDVTSPYNPTSSDPVTLSVEDLVVSISSSGKVSATGVVRNTSNIPVRSESVNVEVALHDSSGRLLNVIHGLPCLVTALDQPNCIEVLQPGDMISFSVYPPLDEWGPYNYETTMARAVASP